MAGEKASEDTNSGLKYLRFCVCVELNIVNRVSHSAFEACCVVEYHEGV